MMVLHERDKSVDVMICLLRIDHPTSEPNHVAISLPWRKCTKGACEDALMVQGMMFESESPSSLEDFMKRAWESLNFICVVENIIIEAGIDCEKTDQERINLKKDAEKKVAPSRKKKDAPSTLTASAATVVLSEESKKKQKTKEKANLSKELILTLDNALFQRNILTMKTKENEVKARYKALNGALC